MNNKNCTDFTPKDVQPMARLAIWQKRLKSLSKKSENRYIQSLRTLVSQKQHVNSKEWEPLRGSKTKSGVWI